MGLSIVAKITSISTEVVRHYETGERTRYKLEHWFKLERGFNSGRESFKVEVQYFLDDDTFDGCLMRKEGLLDDRWSYLNSTWNNHRRHINFSEVEGKLPNVDKSIIQVVEEKNGNIDDDFTIKLLKLGEHMMRDYWDWRDKDVVIKYGEPKVRKVIPEPKPPKKEHNCHFCDCYDCRIERNELNRQARKREEEFQADQRRYASPSGYNSRALSPSSCGGSDSEYSPYSDEYM